MRNICHTFSLCPCLSLTHTPTLSLSQKHTHTQYIHTHTGCRKPQKSCTDNYKVHIKEVFTLSLSQTHAHKHTHSTHSHTLDAESHKNHVPTSTRCTLKTHSAINPATLLSRMLAQKLWFNPKDNIPKLWYPPSEPSLEVLGAQVVQIASSELSGQLIGTPNV